MGYSQYLIKLFPGLTLHAEDLLLLETFQVKYLPDRVPEKEFAILLLTNPMVHRFLELKYPPIGAYIEVILRNRKDAGDKELVEEACQELLWEIADLIVYNKYPEIYDQQSGIFWEINDITSVTSLEGKTIVDAGAGTGRLAFLVAPFAETVFAVEPVTSMRRFIKEKTARERIDNLFVMDGFLDSIPLPDNSVDVLMTSNAIGWNLQDELREIERVVKPGAHAIHLMLADIDAHNPIHDMLTSQPWNYTCTRFEVESGMKLKYYK